VIIKARSVLLQLSFSWPNPLADWKGKSPYIMYFFYTTDTNLFPILTNDGWYDEFSDTE